MGILELLGVEAVEYTIKVFTEFGSCHEVPLHLICEQLYLCQSLYIHSNGVAQDLSSKPYSHGSKRWEMHMLRSKTATQSDVLFAVVNISPSSVNSQMWWIPQAEQSDSIYFKVLLLLCYTNMSKH